jgi:enoyl-CoA hydratase
VTLARYLDLETLTLEQDDRTLTATFDDPPHHYMTGTLLADLDRLTTAIDDDDTVGAVILTGASDSFITHFDVEELLAGADRVGRAVPEVATRVGVRAAQALARVPGGDRVAEALPAEGLETMRRFADVVLRIQRSGAVYLAAIGGPCGGGGLELVLSFDVRVAADTDVVLGLPEFLIGLTTSVGGQRLAQLLGPARALEMMLEGRLLEPAEALDRGLLNQVVSRDDLLPTVRELAARYARRNRDTVAAQKRIFSEYALFPPAQALARESAASLATITSGATRDALRRFVTTAQRHGGASPFLTDIEPWVDGTATS